MPSPYPPKAPLVALLLTVTACQDPAGPASPGPLVAASVAAARRADGGGGVVPGRYLVRLRAGAAGAGPRVRARLGARGDAAQPFAVGTVAGFAATLSDAEVQALRADADVDAIEPDRAIVGAGVQLDAPWGLDRIDQSALPLGGTYVYTTGGADVTVYVLDGGVDVGHPELAGRAEAGTDFVGSDAGVDCSGHGTHVAGVVAGATYGVAKGAHVVSVRVLDCALRGTMSQAIAALGWVVQQKKAHPTMPTVANLSLEGTGSSTAFDQAVAAALEAGVTVVAAAGNASADACGSSPARVAGVLTVAASDRSDAFASFSGRGACVALAAPGVDVPSAWPGGGARLMSGTSVAAPFVAGAAALYLAQHPAAAPAEVRSALLSHATIGALGEVPLGTPNRLVGVAFLRSAPTLVTPSMPHWPRVERRCDRAPGCTASITPSL